MAANQKLDRMLAEGRAFRFLVERRRVTATALGRHVLRDEQAPLEIAERTGREFGSRLCSAGKAVARRGAFEVKLSRSENLQGLKSNGTPAGKRDVS